MRDLLTTFIAALMAMIFIALICIASAEVVLSIFDWVMGTAYKTSPNVGIGALVALIVFMSMRRG